MDIVFLGLAWYGSGVVGSVLGMLGDRNRGLDITLGSLMSSFLVACFGPVVLLLGGWHFLQHTKPFKGSTSKVILKGKVNE